MKHLLLLIAITMLMPTASAAELSESDAGTYELLREDRTPSGVFFRFTRSGGKWVAFGKTPGKDWENVSCDPGCLYRNSTEKDIRAFFPPSWRESNEIACIQNIAQVFCRFAPSKTPGERGYVFIVLVTGKPFPVRTRRLIER
ncbi:hypothetical protein [Cupriavidus sp. RAF12]|uniref:hypothetical protein n=1 Tax=Cupriavidus sp. RAF12 TaxID=3233050 RepID=UPI003F8E2F8B